MNTQPDKATAKTAGTAARTPVVEVKGVNFSFGQGEGRKQVLYDNHLSLYAGEIIIMTGPSGSGKTTLLTLIGTLRGLQEGSLKVFGNELAGLGASEQEKIRRNIGFIFQAHNLLDSLTAYQNVKLVTELIDYSPGESDRLTSNILTKLGMKERMRYKPQSLSGGQRQRVAIGRALVNRPRLILADEPTAALDKETGRQVVDLLRDLAENEGCTIMIVTHDNRILDVADRIVTMVDGYVASDVDVNESLTIVQFLKKCSVFETFTPTLLADVAGKMQRETHPAGTVIIKQGDEGDKFYIIRRGKLDVLKESMGKVDVVATLEAGAVFGELALLRKEPRAATVKSVEEVELLTLSKDIFMDVIQRSASFEEQLRRVYFAR
ncbi:MAG: ATP-binding cassette domain-containing protein [Smithella sp.]